MIFYFCFLENEQTKFREHTKLITKHSYEINLFAGIEKLTVNKFKSFYCNINSFYWTKNSLIVTLK